MYELYDQSVGSIDIAFRVFSEWFTGNGIAYALSVLILLFLFYWVVKFSRATRPIGANLKSAIEVLKSFPDGKNLRANFSKFDTSLRSNPTMKNAWREFSETLVLGEDADADIRNVYDAQMFFSEQSVVASYLDLSHWRAVPNYLTGLGILFTFAGLVAGIHMAQAGLVQSDPEIVNEALGRLLEGASVAFLTSLVGLVSSIFFSGLLHRKLHRIRLDLAVWNDLLDARLERVTMEGLTDRSLTLLTGQGKTLESQLGELKNQTTELRSFNTDLAVSIAEALDGKIASRLNPALDKLVD